ncbi:unnamed protein product [Urochloa humidicola]
MKRKSIEVDLKTLWDRQRQLKSRNVGSGSASTPQPVTIESEAVPVSDAPSVQPATIESQVQIQPEVADIDVARDVTPEVASNDPDIASTAAAGTEQEQQQAEPSTWSPIRDGDDSDFQRQIMNQVKKLFMTLIYFLMIPEEGFQSNVMMSMNGIL